jgi:hypothetical protein
MKICFLFRGETIRGSANALNNVENWQAMLFKDLPRQDYDITFITYESPILEMLTSFLKPKILLIKPSISQIIVLKIKIPMIDLLFSVLMYSIVFHSYLGIYGINQA